MTASASWELQKSIYATLNTDSTLQDLLGGAGRVHSHVPDGQEMPYVVIRELAAQQWDTSTELGREHTISIHAWSSYEGEKEVHEILMRIKELLHRDEVGRSLADNNLVLMQFTFQDVSQEPDGQAYQGVIQFQAITEETA